VTAATIEYFHILLDDHQIIVANGTPAETLFRGEQTLKTLSSMERLEIEAMFPKGSIQSEAELARRCPKGRQARKLIERHAKNNKSLINDQMRKKIAGFLSFV